MSPRPASPRVLVSIHDVTPAHTDAVHRLWERCRAVGATPALFVVPNWHGQWPLAAHPRFVSWLQQAAAEGAEIVLHGERHDEAGLSRSMASHLRAVGRTAREGEFLTLDRWQARERIERGILYLWSLDLVPQGFVPPAWLARSATHDVVRESGLPFSEDATAVHVHAPSGSTRVSAPAVRWSGRSTWRAHASRLAVGWQWRRAARSRLARLALHPQDLQHPVTARSVIATIGALPTRGIPTRYASLHA